jgi:hypothetical protein
MQVVGYSLPCQLNVPFGRVSSSMLLLALIFTMTFGARGWIRPPIQWLPPAI